jgi:hypothetical protein
MMIFTAPPPTRICDPYNTTITFPACEFCNPYNIVPGTNGCTNYGLCLIKPVDSILPPAQSSLFPPGAEMTICGCSGHVAPQCVVDIFTYFGQYNVYDLRFIYVAAYIVIMTLAILCIVEHVYHCSGSNIPEAQQRQILGLSFVAASNLLMILFFSYNYLGVNFGYYNLPIYWFETFYLGNQLCFSVDLQV